MFPLSCPAIGSGANAAAPCGFDANTGAAIAPVVTDVLAYDWQALAGVSGYISGTILTVWIMAHVAGALVGMIR